METADGIMVVAQVAYLIDSFEAVDQLKFVSCQKLSNWLAKEFGKQLQKMILALLTLTRFWRSKKHSTPVALSYHASMLVVHDYQPRKLIWLSN